MLFGFVVLSVIFQNEMVESKVISSVESNKKWELAKNKNGVEVYTCQVIESKIKEFKAVTIVSCRMKKLEGLVDKVSDYPNWQENITTAKTFKKISNKEKVIYYTSEVPWTISNRDVVVSCKKTVASDGVVTYNIKGASGYISMKDGFVRIKDIKGKWQFTPLKIGEIEVVYQFLADPAGSIPNWLINMFIADGPYQTLMNIKAKCKQ